MTSLMLKRAGAGLLLAALLLWPALAQQELQITIARIGGTVEVQHATQTKGAWAKAKKDQVIGSGWNLRTAAGSKVQLVFPLDNVVILKENSLLTVDNLDAGGGAKVNAKSGSLLVDIKRALSPGSTFEVKTPSALAVVRGTKFAVEIAPAGTRAGGGGPLVALNFMLAGQPMQALQAHPDFGLLLGGGSIFEADADGDGTDEPLLSGAHLQALLEDEDAGDDAAGNAQRASGGGDYVRNYGFEVEITGVSPAGHEELELSWDEPAAGAARSQQKPLAQSDRRSVQLVGVGDLDDDGLEDYAFRGGRPAAQQFASMLDSFKGEFENKNPLYEPSGRNANPLYKDGVRTGDNPLSDSGKREGEQQYTAAPWDDLDGDGVDDIALLSAGYKAKTGKTGATKLMDDDPGAGDAAAGKATQPLTYTSTKGKSGSAKREIAPGGGADAGDGTDVASPLAYSGKAGKTGRMMNRMVSADGDEVDAQDAGDLDGDGIGDFFFSGDLDGDGADDSAVPGTQAYKATQGKSGKAAQAKRETAPGGTGGGAGGSTQTHNQLGKGRQNGLALGDLDGDGADEVGVDVGDLDQDGLPDYVVAFGSGPRQTTAQDGSFSQKSIKQGHYAVSNFAVEIDGEKLSGRSAGDVDGDGVADIVVGSALTGRPVGQPAAAGLGAHVQRTPGVVVVATGDLDGDGAAEELEGEVVDDLDGDGLADIIVKSGGGPNGQGLRVGGLADFDGDGVVDALDDDSDGDGRAELVVGDLDGDGQPERAFPGGDADGDGVPDMVILSSFSHGAGALTNTQKSKHDAAMAAIQNTRREIATPSGGGGTASPLYDAQGLEAANPVYNGQELGPGAFGGPHVKFHGYEGTVEISNAHGTSMMPAGTSVDADGSVAPSPAGPSGDDAQQFLEEAQDTELFDAFDALAEQAAADLSPIRAGLLAEDRKLEQYEEDFARHVRVQDIGKMMLIWVQLEPMRGRIGGLGDRMQDILGLPRTFGNGHDVDQNFGLIVERMQEMGVPDTDLPPLAVQLLERIEALTLDLEPYLKGHDELLDRAQGLLDPGDPRGSIRNDLLDTDNDGIGDALELELGTDPLLNNSGDGFIELIAPDDSDSFNFPPDAELYFEFEPLDTDAALDYNLVLSAGGQQAVRRNVRERERFTLAQLAGPQGLLAGAVDASGELDVTWYVEAVLRRARPGLAPIRSEQRSFMIQTPANDMVEVNLRLVGPARVGTPVQIAGDITEVNALGEWEIEIAYDPQFLTFAQGGKAGLFNSSTVFFNDAGSGLLTVSGQVPAGNAGISGEGDIFTLSFNPVVAGLTEVEVAGVALRDTLGREIEGRPGDSAEVNIARRGSGGPVVSAGGPLSPGGSTPDSAQLGLGPLLLAAPARGSSVSYPAETELVFEYDELDTNFDVVYNLILSAGGAQKKYGDFASGDGIPLEQLLLGTGPFAKAAGAQGLALDWRVEAEVDTGASQPERVVSETWQVTLTGPRNGTVTLDLGALGNTRNIAVGDPVRVRGSLSEVEGLGEFELVVRYDSAVLEFVSGRKVGIFSKANVRVDDAGPGKVVISGSATGGGISGDGAVFELEFEARGDGSAVVEPDQPALRDILGQAIDGSAGDEVEVDVADPAAGGAGAPGGAGGPKDPFGNGRN